MEQAEKQIARMTSQRAVILEELQKTTAHPTAEELYEAVRQRLPHVSLATVYRNLDQLAEAGQIRRMCVGGEKKRFDAFLEEHYHVRCQDCGRVDDVPVKQIAQIKRAAEMIPGYEITGHALEFQGYCPACQKKKKEQVKGQS